MAKRTIKTIRGRGRKKPPAKGRPQRTAQATVAPPAIEPEAETELDESGADDIPPLRPIDPADFDRIMVLGGHADRQNAVRLARWLCAGLKKLRAEDRRGVAYIQIDEPLGEDLAPFRGNVFFPAEPVVACVTGTSALVNAICVGAMKKERLISGGRFGYKLSTLPVWAIAQDNNVVLTRDAYFGGLQPALREAGWTVWTVAYNIYDMGWGSVAADGLASLPAVVPGRIVTGKA